MKFSLTIIASLFFLPALCQEHYLLVGTYDSPKSEGIYVYRFNSSTGTAKEMSHIKTSDPSFLAISPDEKYVFAVNENADSTGKGGGVSSFSFDKTTGKLTVISKQSSEGNHPCYISVDKTGKWVIAGNYSSGNLSVLPVLPDGILEKATDTIQHAGKGPNTERQLGPHVHATVFSPDNKYLLVTDLGLDRIISYEFDALKGKLNHQQAYIVYSTPGTGPRHLDFSPSGNNVYVLHELASQVESFRWNNGNLFALEQMTTMPKTYSGPAGSADIHVSPDGKFLYASNRANSNTIAIFSIGRDNGKLKLVGHQSTLGLTPRNFNFDPTGKFLLVGNQNSDEIVIFKRNIKKGLLTDTGHRISVGKPVCIKWISTK